MLFIMNNIIKGFVALCLFIWAILMPKVGGYAFIAVYVAFQAYLFFIDSLKPNPDPSKWSAHEIAIIRKYHPFLRFPFGARILSNQLNGFRWIGLLFLTPWLLWNHMWIAAAIVVISFVITASISVRLDPLFFLGDAVNRCDQTQFASELALLKQVSERLWERARTRNPATILPTTSADKGRSGPLTDEEAAVDRLPKGFHSDQRRFGMAKDCYQTGKYCDAVLHTKESIAFLKSLPYNAEKFVHQRDELVEMVEVCVRSLCKLGRVQEGLAECDRAIGYFNAFVEGIQDLREHGSDLDEEELDKLEELAICQALGLSQFLSAIKKETGADLPPDYDPGFRIQRT